MIRYPLFVLAMACVSLMVACSSERDARLQELTAELEKMQTRVGKLEWQLNEFLLAPRVDFVVQEMQFSIDDSTFEPRVIGSAIVLAKAERVPPVLYVEVQVSVDWPGNRQPLQQVALYRVASGRAQVAFSIPVPSHNLKQADMRITLTTLGWLRGYPASG